ncbi:MAG: hypothetical protein FJ134_07535 [Deltaproteobacteria bacterium]|nr:hypothetical protein [Deltaproteobacteria bacterium]
MSLHWFYDEIPEDYRNFRRLATPLEREYLELRVLLRNAEAALKDAPDNEKFQAQVKYFRKRVADLEGKHSWLAEEIAKEIGLWGVPH